MAAYNLDDVLRSYRWLGHHGAYTELSALHPEYRPGREGYAWNLEHKTFPIIAYARTEEDVRRFVQGHAGRLCCFGLQPRDQVFTNEKGYPRSARDPEIQTVTNLLFDIDPTRPDSAGDAFLEGTRDYFLNRGFLPPIQASSGRGWHLLFAFPPIKRAENPDIAERLRTFRNEFAQAYQHDFEMLGLSLCNTQDLSRKVKMYGTSKPGVGILSTFPNQERREDERLREYLLNLQLPATTPGTLTLDIKERLPEWFDQLLTQDLHLRDLWHGQGKHDGDQSRSGYDFTITRRLLRLGHRQIDELATILSLREHGAVKETGKHEEYVRRTIANALLK